MTYVLDDHDQERQLDGKSLLVVDWAGDEVGGHIGSHDLEHRGLDISVGQSLDVTVSHISVPNLEWLGSTTREQLAHLAAIGRSRALTQWSRE